MKSRANPSGSRLQRMFYEVRHANRALGFDEIMMRETLMQGIWDFSYLTDCHAAELHVPIGPWFQSPNAAEEARMKAAGRLLQKSLQAVQSGHEVVLNRLGFRGSELERWMKEIDAELKDDLRKWFLDVRVLWGQRRVDDTSGHIDDRHSIPDELYPLSSVPTTKESRESSPTQNPNSHYRIFTDPKAWYDTSQQRSNQAGRDPLPFVYRRSRSKSCSRPRPPITPTRASTVW
ncbi:hypothetical protein FRB91_004110 [Serendipita sp. 411]|nr:hypothetical protein FRB91_004110 [Serendipita sp. 411]